MLKPAVFLDRDGVINKEKGYVYEISQFDWVDGAKEAIRYLNENNYHVFVVTNQSGIARGLYSAEDVNYLHKFINKELIKQDAYIDEFFISPYHPDFALKYKHLSHLRKPETGMLEAAEQKWRIKKDSSFMIGDKDIDIECAKNFGIKGHLFKGGNLLDFIKSYVDIKIKY